MKRLSLLLLALSLLLAACMSIDEENVPTAPEITAPKEPWEQTVPLPTDHEGNLKELE